MFPYARRSAVSEPTPRNLSQLEPAKRWFVQGRYCLACPNESPSARAGIVKRPMSCSVLAEAGSLGSPGKTLPGLILWRTLQVTFSTSRWQMTQCGVLSHWVVTDDSMRSPVTLGRDRSPTRSSATLTSDRNLTRGSVTLTQDRNSTQSSITRSHDIVGRRSYVTLFHKNKGRQTYVNLFHKNKGWRSYDTLFHKNTTNENIIFISRQT